MIGILKKLKRRVFSNYNIDEASIYKRLKSAVSRNGDLFFVGKLLARSAQRNANRVALIRLDDTTITYKELFTRVVLLSKKLRDNGVQPRDRVLVYCENSIEFYIFYFAVWHIGAVCVPVNVFLHERELAHVISDAQPRVILASNILKRKLDTLDDLPLVLTEDDIDWQYCVPRTVRELLLIEPGADLGIDEMALLLYTSGTTGVPKGVMLSSRNILTNTMQSYSRMRTFSQQRERFFAVLPLFHVFAQNTCMWMPVLSGSSIIVVPRIERKHILTGLQKNPTMFFGFPALFGLLCLMKTAPIYTIKRFISGADAMPDKIRTAFAMIYGRKICSGYGLTEASPVVAINHNDEEQPSNVVGKPLPGIECDIRDEQEQSLEPGQTGNLWIRGDNIMLGYYNAQEETDKVLKDGWLNTGDLATFDKFGNFAINGRTKDVIIHKGFNIYPQEVENILMSHPLVFKAAVIGREESVSGQVPIAFVAVKQNERYLEAQLRTLCARSLASYKIPRKIICLEDLPMSPTGKVDKKKLNVGIRV